MPEPSTSDVSTPGVRAAVLGLAALFIWATGGVTFFVVGLLAGPEPADPDYLWRPWSPLSEHETAIGIVSTVVFVVAGLTMEAARRRELMPTPLLPQVVILTLFSAWLGLGYQIVTAGVIGANIGGGGVLFLTPVLAVAALGSVVGLGIWSAQRAKRTGLSSR